MFFWKCPRLIYTLLCMCGVPFILLVRVQFTLVFSFRLEWRLCRSDWIFWVVGAGKSYNHLPRVLTHSFIALKVHYVLQICSVDLFWITCFYCYKWLAYTFASHRCASRRTCSSYVWELFFYFHLSVAVLT